MSFGFSAGDFVASVSLITKVVKSLNESTGSVAEVKTLAGTLESLKNAIQTSGDFYAQFGKFYGNDGTSLVAMDMRSSIERERQRCDEILESFMKTLKPYQYLFLRMEARSWFDMQEKLDGSSGKTMRLRIESLLQTASSTILSSVLDLRAQVATITDIIQPWQSIPSSLGYPWEVRSALSDTVTLLDAIGRTVLLPWTLMGSIEDLHQLLLIMYRNIPGQKKILGREYNLTDDTDEDQDGVMVDHSNWDTTIRRGMQLSLNIIIPTSYSVDLQSCPQCKTVCFSHDLPQKRRRCRQCQLTFRIFDKERVIRDSSSISSDESSLQAQITERGLSTLNSPCREMSNGRKDTFHFRKIHYHREVPKLQQMNENASGTTITRQLVVEDLPALHKAAATGDVSAINRLLDDGSAADTPLPFDAIFSSPQLPDWTPMKFGGCTPLHLACWFGKVSSIKALLNRGGDVLAQVPEYKFEALTFALLGRDPDSVFFPLVEEGAKLDYQDINGHSPLQTACASGKELLIRYLLDHDANLDSADTDGHTPLQSAARGGHAQAFEVLLAAGADVAPLWRASSEKNDQCSTLHHAAIGGSVKIIKYILRCGQDPDQVDSEGFTSFQLSLHYGHLEAGRLLLQYTGDKFSVTKDGLTTLHSAAYGSLEEFVELLINGGAGINQTEGLYQMTSLHLACHRLNHGSTHAQESTIRFLLQNGAHVNASDVFGETPLHYVAVNGRPRLAEILLRDGANVHATSKLGETPLHFASRKGCNESVKLLIEHGADANARCKNGFTPFLEAVYSGKTETARMLLEHGAAINACDVLGLTALHYAFFSTCGGKEDLLKLLLGEGANAQSSSLDATTPLHYAAVDGHSDLVQLLLDHRADVDVRHGLGRTSLHSAARWGRTGCIEILLASGADIHTTAPVACKVSVPGEEFMLEVGGCTPLICAAEHGHVAAVKLLLDHGASVNISRVDGKTALSCAMESGNIEIIQLLLDHGADVEIPNLAGLTPLIQASRNNKDDIVKIILKRGTAIDARDNEGRTALHWAAFGGFESTARILIEHGALLTPDHLGRTPLHDAVYNGSEPLVKYLLDNGADPMARLAGGTTLACWSGYKSQNTATVEVKEETKEGMVDSAREAEDKDTSKAEAGVRDQPVVRLALDIGRIRGWKSIMGMLVED